MANALQFEMHLPTDAELDRMFDMAPKMERHRLADKVVDAGAKPVLARAKQLCPRSKESDRKKRSKKQMARADWNYPLWKAIKMVVRKYNYIGFAVIGPSWPKGNKAYFNTSPKGRRRMLWGNPPSKDSHLSPVAPQIRNWIVQAFDETKAEQLSAMKAKATEVVHQIMTEK